ncbi:MAG: hypothetical protein P4L33_16860 [Capsulimonadaceae bacterium]|nr:hypothetical protein [Capsulimonadaceae bacterium]
MVWFFGGYVLVAVAFYSYITMTAKEEPEPREMPAGLSAPGTQPAYAKASAHTGRKAA